MWNYSANVYPRTNNSVEAYHGALHRLLRSHPDIYKSIDFFKQIEMRSILTYNQLKIGCLDSKRKAFEIEKDEKLKGLIAKFKSEDILIEDFLSSLSTFIGVRRPSSQLL